MFYRTQRYRCGYLRYRCGIFDCVWRVRKEIASCDVSWYQIASRVPITISIRSWRRPPLRVARLFDRAGQKVAHVGVPAVVVLACNMWCITINEQQRTTHPCTYSRGYRGVCRRPQRTSLAVWPVQYTPCSKKTRPLMFDNNFGKCGSIFKILSPGDS